MRLRILDILLTLAILIPLHAAHAEEAFPAFSTHASAISSAMAPANQSSDNDENTDPDIEDPEEYGLDDHEPYYTDHSDTPRHDSSYRKPLDPNERNWWKLLKAGKLNIADTTVQYPRFLKFCVDTYNWADRVFNSYDTTYVQGTGKRWKARILSDTWVDSYYLNPHKQMPIRMMSDPYVNAGAYLQYMAVSVGYSLDLSNIIGNRPAFHKKLEYSFNCARFNVEGHYWGNTGGTYIRTFPEFKNNHLIKEAFSGVSLKSFEICGYYFFNNRKFSMGAAYNFSKFQRKSAGTALIGVLYSDLDISLDFTKLPDKLKPFLTLEEKGYLFHYRSYSLMGGYSFNWVLSPKWLFNITAMPAIGFTNTYEDSIEGNSRLLALIIKGQGSLTYNIKNYFICAVAKIDGNWYRSRHYSFFSSVENAQLSIGVRF